MTESIAARLRPTGEVRALIFVYATDTSYAAQRAEYIEYLGEPSRSEEVPDEGGVTIWEDESTRFVLAWEQQDTARLHYTLMEDRTAMP